MEQEQSSRIEREGDAESLYDLSGEEIGREYEYFAEVKAREAFRNILYRYGIGIGDGTKRAVFRCEKLIDMKALKNKGVISSYRIALITRRMKMIERG